MPAVYKLNEGVSCRVCGAVRAKPGKYGVCRLCEDKYRAWNSYKDYADDTFTAWLGHELILQLKRKKRYGFAIRCEALSLTGSTVHQGYQCGCFAVTVFKGKFLCSAHGDRGRKNTIFIDDERNVNDYARLSELIRELSNDDPHFRQSVESGLQENG